MQVGVVGLIGMFGVAYTGGAAALYVVQNMIDSALEKLVGSIR